MTHDRHVATIHDVAKKAGVSISTVSRALNDRSVSAAVRERVRAAVETTGYVPNPTGRALRRQRSGSWGVIVPELNEFFTTVVTELETAALTHGRVVLLATSADSLERERRSIADLTAQRMAGVAVAVVSETDSDLSPIIASKTPLVLIDRQLHGYSGAMVLVDNVRSGQLAAEHLLSQGFQTMACISGPAGISTVDDRLAGFANTLKAADHPLDRRYIRRAELTRMGGQEAMRSLLAMPAPPDCVFAVTGPLTVGAYQALEQSPRPPALVGHDNDTWTELVRPAITVISQPVADIGRHAAALLHRREVESQAPGERIVLPSTLIVRQSSLRRP